VISMEETGFKNLASEVLLYKRTHPSRDPANDCKFFMEVVGMPCEYAGTSMNEEGEYCAHRAQATVGPMSYHNIKDSFEPQGMAEEWIETFNSHHTSSFSEDGSNQQWNQFMTLNTGLYTLSLDTHLKKWKEAGTVKYKAHRYVNPTDGELMYVLMTYNPSTGNVMEIHGSQVSDEFLGEFSELPEGVCEQAVAPGHPKQDLELTYQNSMILYADAATDTRDRGAHKLELTYRGYNGFPYAMLVKVSHPANNVEKAVNWMSENAQIDMTVHQDTKSSTCKVAKAMVSKAFDVGKASLMFVEVDAVKDARAKEYIEYVENVHKERMGIQRGYDRFIDSHVGLFYRGIVLDDIAPTLAKNGASFHAFKDVGGNDAFCKGSEIEDYCGSIWSTGTNGLSFEMHAYFDPEGSEFFVDAFSPNYMDMCNSETNKGPPYLLADDDDDDDSVTEADTSSSK
jgi:hypothetical protein